MNDTYLTDDKNRYKIGNTFASKPFDQHTTGKGRTSVDLGIPLQNRLVSYAKHEKRKLKDIICQAIAEKLDKEGA